MVLVIGLNKKPCFKEESHQLDSNFKLEKFKTRQKSQAMNLAMKIASDPSAVSYAFFSPKA